MDMFGGGGGSGSGAVRRCGCGCPMCAAGRCARALYGGQCPCRDGAGAGAGPVTPGLYVSKRHLWNDGLFLMLAAIVILVAFK